MERPRRTAAVVGGGPAGLMAAEVLAGAGLAVTIYERMPSAGRKFMIAGRGGLNLTHSEPLDDFLARYGDARPRLDALVRAFPPQALRDWASGLGQETFVGTSGRIFPKAMKASPLLRAWLRRLASQGVTLATRHRWTGWTADGKLAFERPGAPGLEVDADVVILALGGASWPRLGGDGSWQAILAAKGVAVAPLVSANAAVGIAWSKPFLDRCEGAPLKRIALTCAGQVRRGEAVVTRFGLEGGAVYALGPAIRAALARDGKAILEVDARPDIGFDELAAKLAAPRHKQSLANVLRKAAGLTPVATALAREGAGGPLPSDPAALARAVKRIPLEVTGLAGLERAISSAGGVRFDALDERLMLTRLPGVFVAGEMLDWEAPTGGYLLQATFATGVGAARGALAWLACDHGAP